jgi:hypothetical protein
MRYSESELETNRAAVALVTAIHYRDEEAAQAVLDQAECLGCLTVALAHWAMAAMGEDHAVELESHLRMLGARFAERAEA